MSVAHTGSWRSLALGLGMFAGVGMMGFGFAAESGAALVGALLFALAFAMYAEKRGWYKVGE